MIRIVLASLALFSTLTAAATAHAPTRCKPLTG